jgi:hypothetical protein
VVVKERSTPREGGRERMKYREPIEQGMKTFYDSLSEKDRRRYAAVEAAKLGHGGSEYIASMLGCDPKTIRHGQQELAALPHDTRERVRKKGAAASGV